MLRGWNLALGACTLLLVACQSSVSDGGAPAAMDSGLPLPMVDAGDMLPLDAGPTRDGGLVVDLDAGHDAGASLSADAGDDAGIDAGPAVTEAATAYCECVFVACHDDFHATFGLDDLASIEACGVFASTLPTTQGTAVSGNSLQCRQHWCDALPPDCPSALGMNATCTDG